MGNKLVKAEEAVALIGDGDVVTVGGCLGLCLPEKVLVALERRFLTTGAPKNLTWFDTQYACAGPGREHFAHEGMLCRVIGVSYYFSPELRRLIRENTVQGYCMPMGVTHGLVREIASAKPGFLTKVGLHSSYDPRLLGGKLNAVAQESLAKVVSLEGEEWLYYRAFPIDVAIIRGTSADEDGNVSIEEEPLTLDMRFQALAAKASGGKVIAQVKRVVASGSIPPRSVEVPGILVDAIVVDESQAQNESFPDRYLFGVDGRMKAKQPPIPLLPLDADKIISRRAALELRPGDLINVGGGIPMYHLTLLTLEEGIQDLLNVTVEHGAWGGINYGSTIHVNPACLMPYDITWTLYLGGNLDATYLGFGQLDRHGNANLDRVGEERPGGSGGALTIEHATEKVVLLGNFTSGGLSVAAGDGRLEIRHEGRHAKLVNNVDWISFNGRVMREKGKEVMIITERAVFRLESEGLVLTEIAPGVDLERDILQQMEFRPLIAATLRTMDERIFRRAPLGLRQALIGEPFDATGAQAQDFQSGHIFGALAVLAEAQFRGAPKDGDRNSQGCAG